MKYKKCKKCLAHYPANKEYVHQCDGLMKLLVEYHKKNK